MKLAELRAMRRTLSVPYGEFTVHVTYKLGEITGATETGIVSLLTNVIDTWDITDESGDPIPVTKEAIEGELPWGLVMGMYDAINADSSPGKANGAT
jgi:hypothetical protein